MHDNDSLLTIILSIITVVQLAYMIILCECTHYFWLLIKVAPKTSHYFVGSTKIVFQLPWGERSKTRTIRGNWEFQPDWCGKQHFLLQKDDHMETIYAWERGKNARRAVKSFIFRPWRPILIGTNLSPRCIYIFKWYIHRTTQRSSKAQHLWRNIYRKEVVCLMQETTVCLKNVFTRVSTLVLAMASRT